MGFTCVVPLCGNRSKPKSDKTRKYTFHAVPFTNPVRWKIWTKRCPYLRKYSLRQLESVRICNKHFLPHEIVQEVNFRRLTKDAIPSLYLPQMEAENILEIRPIKPNKPIQVKVVGLNLNFVSQDEMTEAVSKVPFMIAKLKENKYKFLTKKEMNRIRRKKKRTRLSFLRADSARSNLPVDHQLYALPVSGRNSCLTIGHDQSTLTQPVENMPIDHSLYTLQPPVSQVSTMIDDNDLCTSPVPIGNTVECVTTEHPSENITILNDELTAEMKIEPTNEHFITVTHNKEAYDPSENLPNMESRDINYYLTQATEIDTNLNDLLSNPAHTITTQAYADIIRSLSIEGYQHSNALLENRCQQEGPIDEEILNLGLDTQAVTLDNMENINNILSESNHSITLENDEDILHHFLNFAGKDKHCDPMFVNESAQQVKNEIMDSALDDDNVQKIYNMLADAVHRMSPEIDEGSSQYEAFLQNASAANEQYKPLNSDNIKIEFDAQAANVDNVCEGQTVIPDVISQTNSQESPSVFLTPNIFNLLTSKSPLEAQTIESLRVLFSTIKEKHNLPVDTVPMGHSHVDKFNINESLLNNITLTPSEDNMIRNVNIGHQIMQEEPGAICSTENPVQCNDTTVADLNPVSQYEKDNAILSTKVHLDEKCTNREKLMAQKISIYKKRLHCAKVRYDRLKNNPINTKKSKAFFQNYCTLSDNEKLLIDLQLRTVGKKKNGLRYTEEELNFARDLYKINHESYRFLQQYLRLPKSKTTIFRSQPIS